MPGNINIIPFYNSNFRHQSHYCSNKSNCCWALIPWMLSVAHIARIAINIIADLISKKVIEPSFSYSSFNLSILPLQFEVSAHPVGSGKKTFIAKRYPTNINETITGNIAIIQSEKKIFPPIAPPIIAAAKEVRTCSLKMRLHQC